MMSKTDNRLRSGCGCLLMGLGMAMVAVGILFAVVSYTADRDAGEKNRQEWADYEAQQPVIDSLRQAGVADSIIWEQYPQPHIRQGGLAAFLGALVGGGIVVAALIPLLIGWGLRKIKKLRN